MGLEAECDEARRKGSTGSIPQEKYQTGSSMSSGRSILLQNMPFFFSEVI